MCLSTIYKNEKQDNNILCKFVATITADGDRLTFEDPGFVLPGFFRRLVQADLTAGTVIVAAD